MSPFTDKNEIQLAFCQNVGRALRETGINMLSGDFLRKSVLPTPPLHHNRARMPWLLEILDHGQRTGQGAFFGLSLAERRREKKPSPWTQTTLCQRPLLNGGTCGSEGRHLLVIHLSLMLRHGELSSFGMKVQGLGALGFQGGMQSLSRLWGLAPAPILRASPSVVSFNCQTDSVYNLLGRQSRLTMVWIRLASGRVCGRLF